MDPIFQNFSPMSPLPVDEVMENLDAEMESKLSIIDDLVKKEENEMATLAKIMYTQDRSGSRRKRKRTPCKGCRPSFKNACLDCKQNFASKKLKNIHNQKTNTEKELSDIKEKRKLHQEAREMRRPAEIWEEARRKELEAAQLEADELKKEPMDEDYTTESATNTESRSTNAGEEEMKEESSVKTESPDSYESIGLPNQVKSEPADQSPLVDNDVYMNIQPNVAESPLSDDDMNIVNVNGADYNSLYAHAADDANPANDASAFEPYPWWFPYENEFEAIIHSF